MSIRNTGSPYGGGPTVVDHFIGRAYPVVKFVSDNMHHIHVLSDQMESILTNSNNIVAIRELAVVRMQLLAVHAKLLDLQTITNNMASIQLVATEVDALVELHGELGMLRLLTEKLPQLATLSEMAEEITAMASSLPEIMTVAQGLNNLPALQNIVEQVEEFRQGVANLEALRTDLSQVKEDVIQINEAIDQEIEDRQQLGNRVDKAILSYPNYVSAEADADGLPDGQRVEIETDESHDGRSTQNEVQDGVIVFVGFSGLELNGSNLTPTDEWSVIPQVTGESVAQIATNNAQAQALANRSMLLKTRTDTMVMHFPLTSDAAAMLAKMQEGQRLEIEGDETRAGLRTRYVVRDGELSFVGYVDVAGDIAALLVYPTKAAALAALPKPHGITIEVLSDESRLGIRARYSVVAEDLEYLGPAFIANFTTVPSIFVGDEITVTTPHLRKMLWNPAQGKYERAPWHQPCELFFSYDNPASLPNALPVRADVVWQQSDFPDVVERLGLSGAGTFSLVEARGEGVRVLDNGRGIDASRVLRSLQLDSLQGHAHAVMNDFAGGGKTSNITRTGGDGSMNSDYGEFRARTIGPDGVNGAPRVANETRMRNIAFPLWMTI